ncbi:phage baseplate assembly protein V [Oryzomicrobium sp.]|uniref:phage baseplate assembly protein V n=1 Tax=Oryzomicrobium sp. TaxID=1911578 RepID=UPI002FE3576C
MIATIDTRIRRALGAIRQAFRGRGGAIDTTAPVQLIDGEGLAGEPIRGAELMQHYGFTSTPPSGFMYVAVPVGGKTSHAIVVATEHGTYRLKGLKTGEVAIYTDEGDSIVMKRGRLIEVTTETYRVNAAKAIEFNAPAITGNATGSVAFNTPEVTASAVVTAQGQINGNGGMAIKGGKGSTFAGDVTQTSGSFSTDGDVRIAGKSQLHHRHPETGSITGEQS